MFDLGTITKHEQSPETSLYEYRARYYDSSPGRFLNEDPLQGGGGGPNFYSYVRNNSTNLVDPFGLNPFAPTIPWPWLPPVSIPWGKILGATGRAVAIPLTVALELTLGAEATNSRDDVVPKPKDCDKDKNCDQRYASERDFCFREYANHPNLLRACLERAFWRRNNCKRGFPDPGPLDPLDPNWKVD